MKRSLSIVNRNLLQRLQTYKQFIQKNTVHNTRPTYIWRDICLKKTVYMGYNYNWATRNNDRGRACQNTASYWRKYTKIIADKNKAKIEQERIIIWWL